MKSFTKLVCDKRLKGLTYEFKSKVHKLVIYPSIKNNVYVINGINYFLF